MRLTVDIQRGALTIEVTGNFVDDDDTGGCYFEDTSTDPDVELTDDEQTLACEKARAAYLEVDGWDDR